MMGSDLYLHQHNLGVPLPQSKDRATCQISGHGAFGSFHQAQDRTAGGEADFRQAALMVRLSSNPDDGALLTGSQTA